MDLRPDFNRFLAAVRHQETDRVPLGEILIDYSIQGRFLGRPVTADDLAARALPADVAPAARKFDLRDYGIGAQILRDLGVGKMKLLATPRKMPAMDGFGLEVIGYYEGN